MALFRKKNQEDAADGGKGDGAFVAQPDKARKWFTHARTMADSFNFESALVYYANGVKLDPEAMSTHEAMYEAAIKYMTNGGKPATGTDIKKIDGPDPVSSFAAAEFAWMKELDNAKLAVKALDAAVKANQLEYGHWVAKRVFGLIRRSKKVSKGLAVQAMQLFRDVAAWDEAIAMGQLVTQIDPTDGKLAAEIKNLSAQRAMDEGGYERNVGEEGGYRESVKDLDRQRELEEGESIAANVSTDERNMERAREAYEESPGTPDLLNRYAQLLRKTGTEDAEDRAYQVYMKGFEDTGEYRFRMNAGDIMIDRARRAAAEAGDDSASPDEMSPTRQKLLDLQSSEYRERVARYPTDRQLKYRLGEVEFELGNVDEAMAGFQAAKDEPKLRVRAGHMLGRCFARETWHTEAIGEYKEALDAIDATEKDRELSIRYDLMVSLIEHARAERSTDLAREALEICSGIARKDITYRDIRVRRKEVDAMIKEMG